MDAGLAESQDPVGLVGTRYKTPAQLFYPRASGYCWMVKVRIAALVLHKVMGLSLAATKIRDEN